MDCKTCRHDIPDDSVFCEHCGSRQTPLSAVPAADDFQPAHQAVAQSTQGLGGSLQGFWSPLSLANKLAFVGSIAAFGGFFLPWVDLSKLGRIADIASVIGGNPNSGISGDPNSSISGWTIAQSVGAFYFIPVLAVVACVLLYLAIQHRQNYSRTLQASGWLVLIGTFIGPVILGAGRYRGYGLCRPWRPGDEA